MKLLAVFHLERRFAADAVDPLIVHIHQSLLIADAPGAGADGAKRRLRRRGGSAAQQRQRDFSGSVHPDPSIQKISPGRLDVDQVMWAT